MTAVLSRVMPRFNVAPTQTLPVLRRDSDGIVADLMKWGLVPFWDRSEKPKIAPINARVEDVLSKPTFKQSMQKRRCLVPADGFFEWKRLDAEGTLKVPYHIQRRGGQPFTFAGIYESATELRPASFAFLTTGPNELMASIHNRMPVILSREGEERWLADGPMDAETLTELGRPFPAADMEAFVVSRLVNSPRNDVPECVAPVPAEEGLDFGGGPNSA